MQTTDVSRSSVVTALDVAVAPQAAFARLGSAPTWRWAFVIATVLAIIAAIAVTPVSVHVLSVELPARLGADPQMAKLPPDARAAQIRQIVGAAQAAVRYSFILVPFGLALSCALEALIMLVANAIGKGQGTFKTLWAVAVNASIVGTGLSSIALMVIVLLRGSESFAATADIPKALPGLGMLVPDSAKALAAFCSVLNVFAIWNAVLLAVGMTIVARLPRNVAIGAAIFILAGTGIVPLAGAAFGR